MLLSLCDNSTVQQVMSIINLIIKIICIVVPIILIVSLSLRIAKSVSSGDDVFRDLGRDIITKVVAAILVFFIPTFVRTIADATMTDTEWESCLDISVTTAFGGRQRETDELIDILKASMSEIDYQKALSSVNKLDDGEYKRAKLEELKTIKEKINLKNEVNYSIKNGNENTYNDLIIRVNRLEDGTFKNNLMAKLEILRNRLNTENAARIPAPALKNNTYGLVANISPSYPPKPYKNSKGETMENITVSYYEASNGKSFSFWIYLPEDMSGDLPMSVYLHSLGGLGDDYNYNSYGAIAEGPIHEVVTRNKNYDAVLVHMQVPGNDYVQNHIGAFKELTDKIADELNVDRSKISVSGFSHGCYGTIHMVNNYRKFWSADALIGCNPAGYAEGFRYTPTWAIVGSGDGRSSMPGFVNQVNALGGKAKFIQAPLQSHDVVSGSYSVYDYPNIGLMDFLLGQTRTDVK